MSSNLQDRTVVIVGGTSGIGLSAAQQAKAAGAKVIVSASTLRAPSVWRRRTPLPVGVPRT